MTTVAEAAKSGNAAADDLVPVAVESLRSASNLDFDLYLIAEGQHAPRLYRGRHVPLRVIDLNHLLERGVETLYVTAGDVGAYRNFLREHVLADASLPMVRRYEILAQAARAVFEEAMHQRDTAAIVAVSADLARQISKLIADEDHLLLDLIEVMLHDYTTYAHATRVCTYALLVAKSVGIYDRDALVQIATGALLHDIGKLFVADTIVAKNYRLTPPERECMREHPAQGFVRLAKREDLSWGTLMMVYQHHERVDGCGYPVGSCQQEIHEWARVCSIANTYDALLRDGSVRDTAAMQQVLRNLELQSGRSLDEEFTRCWIETIRSSLPSA